MESCGDGRRLGDEVSKVVLFHECGKSHQHCCLTSFRFIWRRDSTLSGGSKVTVEWTVPLNAAPGKYRLRHFGYYKSLFGGTFPYSGTSKSFEVIE